MSILAMAVIGTGIMPWIMQGVFAALLAMQVSNFLLLCGAFITAGIIVTGLNSIIQYLSESLAIDWRNYLSNRIISKYLQQAHHYLDLSRNKTVLENPGQRIQESIKTFTNTALNLVTEFVRSTFILIVAITGLCLTAGPVMVGITVLSALVVAWTANKIGNPLAHFMQREQVLESQYRKNADFIEQKAEQIALEEAEDYYQQQLNDDLQFVSQNMFKKLYVNIKLTAFRTVAYFTNTLLPYLLSAPAYFAGVIDFTQISQVGMLFSHSTMALNWFIDSYQQIKTYETSLGRFSALDEAMSCTVDLGGSGIYLDNASQDILSVRDLSVTYPTNSSAYILKHLNLQVKKGERVLIQAPSGYGKSTLLKVIQGTWRYGEGQVIRPKKIYCLPQTPLIPMDTLKNVLAYPERNNRCTDEDYRDVLQAVGLSEFQDELNKTKDWSNALSGGQQQRLVIARVLLKHPEWLLLDEAMASLDEDSAAQLYKLICERLPNSTIITISHRKTARQFHDRVFNFEKSPSFFGEKQSQNEDVFTLFDEVLTHK